ncbi:hypothetical protein BC749_103227 [Flavobacterium araucananum]|nr:hypothetical protein BC749_103227 [Flavobacterium araucananum]
MLLMKISVLAPIEVEILLSAAADKRLECIAGLAPKNYKNNILKV